MSEETRRGEAAEPRGSRVSDEVKGMYRARAAVALYASRRPESERTIIAHCCSAIDRAIAALRAES